MTKIGPTCFSIRQLGLYQEDGHLMRAATIYFSMVITVKKRHTSKRGELTDSLESDFHDATVRQRHKIDLFSGLPELRPGNRFMFITLHRSVVICISSCRTSASLHHPNFCFLWDIFFATIGRENKHLYNFG